MAAPSNMIPLGTIAPEFELLDTKTGKKLSLQQLKSNTATVIMFICNHCPYVKHIMPKLVEVATNYQARGINFIAISSNDVKMYPQDSPEMMQKEAQEKNFPFPYLFDETQTVALNYQAACTPDFYIFDKNLHCVYRGRFDDSTPGNQIPVTGKDIQAALDALLAQKQINTDQKPSLGCSIKWR